MSILTGLPLPLTAIQVLWLNIVTNGIQDKALAFEAKEGDELKRKPRRPKEPIFDRLMIERVFISAVTIAVSCYILFSYLIQIGVSEFEARNLTLLLMVLFQNIMIGNCRSETKSAIFFSPFKNPVLLLGVLVAPTSKKKSLNEPGQ